MSADFYVGYEPRSPQQLSRRTRRVTMAIVLASLCAGLVLTIHQGPIAGSVFEFGQFRIYRGALFYGPAPFLQSGASHYLLVAPGKFGLPGSGYGHSGLPVTLEGSLAYRGGQRMLEVKPGTLQHDPGGQAAVWQEEPLGRMTLRGEIVDSKCYLGVMNPSEGKVHRDCAIRCISGGIPPALAVKDALGKTMLLMLTNPDGQALSREILAYVAEPVAVDGLLVRRGPVLHFRIDPANIRRE